MKILYLSHADIKGGAAKGAYRLHRGLLKNGIDSQMLVRMKYSQDPTVIGPSKERMTLNLGKTYIGNQICKLQKSKNKTIRSINIFPSNLSSFINSSDADLVIMHWVGGEMMSIKDIGKINKPIIWRFADQWAFCGTEHYLQHEEDLRYIEGYNGKNRPNGDKGPDLDKWTWKRKVKHWSNKKIWIVTGSKWLGKCTQESSLFKNNPVTVIPSGLDMDVYKPIDKKIAREILNLPQDQKLILFGSMSATSDKRKGFHLLQPALKHYAKRSNIPTSALIFGSSKPVEEPDFGLPTIYLSMLQDDWSLVLAYSAADVFVLPTMHDNLPYTIIEAMACKTPCISFDVGGLADMIEHEINGYLIPPYDTDKMGDYILEALSNDKKRLEMGAACRKKSLKEYDVNVQVNRYLKLIKDHNLIAQ